MYVVRRFMSTHVRETPRPTSKSKKAAPSPSGSRAGDDLAFSRQQVLEARVLNMNDVVEDIRKMLGRLINEDIVLTIDLDPGLGRMKADQG
jgi:hypothetical protein